MVSESNPVIKAKRRAGRVKRWVKRKVYERNIGRQYKAWLALAEGVVAGSTDHDVTISIIVPVYNPPVRFLQECLESVLRQQARNWQLVVANDGRILDVTLHALSSLIAHAHPVVAAQPNSAGYHYNPAGNNNAPVYRYYPGASAPVHSGGSGSSNPGSSSPSTGHAAPGNSGTSSSSHGSKNGR